MIKMHLSIAIASVTACLGCGDSGTSPVDPRAQERGTALAQLGTNVILPTYQAFVEEAAALTVALDEYATSPNETTRAAARAAWESTIDVWQRAEVMQVGPAAPMGDSPGGEDRRDEIYAWPSLDRCAIDQETVGERYDDESALAEEAIDERGLGAIEYLIFNEDAGNTCSPLNAINADGTWASFSASQIEERRARHAHTLAVLVAAAANALIARWEVSGGNFLQEMTDPTRAGALFGTAQEGLNTVSDAIFYLDTETKDMKFAEPADISMSGCGAANCVEARESRFANRSKEHMVANLRGFQLLYLGGAPGTESRGFDDLLREMNATELADAMAARIEAAITAMEAIPGTFAEAIANDAPEVDAAHMALKAVTDDLKTTFVSTLDLEVPGRAAGDTD